MRKEYETHEAHFVLFRKQPDFASRLEENQLAEIKY
jgi:hypothetical protein